MLNENQKKKKKKKEKKLINLNAQMIQKFKIVSYSSLNSKFWISANETADNNYHHF